MGFGKNPQILLFFLQVCELNRCRFPISLKKWCPFLTNFSWLFPPSPKAAPRPSDAGFSLEHGALRHQKSCRVCSPRFHGTGSTAPQARPAPSTPSDLRGFEALFRSPGRRAVTLALVKPTLLAGGAACRTPCGSCPSGTLYLSAQTAPWPAPSRPSQGTGIPLSAAAAAPSVPAGASGESPQPAIADLAPSPRAIEIQSTDQIIGPSPKKEALGSCVTNQSGPFKQHTRLEQAPEQTRAENPQLSKAGFKSSNKSLHLSLI